jgi:hypothetical protein
VTVKNPLQWQQRLLREDRKLNVCLLTNASMRLTIKVVIFSKAGRCPCRTCICYGSRNHRRSSYFAQKYQYSNIKTDYSKPLNFLQITARTERSLFPTSLMPNVCRMVKTFRLSQELPKKHTEMLPLYVHCGSQLTSYGTTKTKHKGCETDNIKLYETAL